MLNKTSYLLIVLLFPQIAKELTRKSSNKIQVFRQSLIFGDLSEN